MPTQPRNPASHHYQEAKRTLDTIGALGADDADRIVECLVALTHAVLSIAAQLTRPSAGGYDFERDH